MATHNKASLLVDSNKYGSTSESHVVNSGVPQGTMLAPLYFYVSYINDLPLSINANAKM